MVRDRTIRDGQRLEVVANGLPLFHGAQLAVDTTLVSPVSRDGFPHPRCVREDWAVLAAARRRKERTHPELTGQFGRTRLVVLAGEVGGKWSDEKQAFLRQLATELGLNRPQQARARAAWLKRWRTILVCSQGVRRRCWK